MLILTIRKTPELVVSVDKARAAEIGITAEEISQTLEVMLGGKSKTTFVERGEEYDVYLRGMKITSIVPDLSRIYLRTSTGALITLDAVTQIEEVASSIKLSHYDKQKSITISANLSYGHTLGEALDYLDEKAIEQLPKDISIRYAGESKDFRESQSGALFIFVLAMLVAYLVLAAQFESFVNPLVVMFTVPMGVLGGLLALYLLNQGLIFTVK